jgi:hypothetical protein
VVLSDSITPILNISLSDYNNVREQRRGTKTPEGYECSSRRNSTALMYPIGLLAPVGDPLGKALGTGLRPLGVGVETITKPITDTVGGVTKPALGPIAGTQDEKMEVLGGNNKDSYEHTKESIGGKLQTGDNPLGLDQTGRFGFRDE